MKLRSIKFMATALICVLVIVTISIFGYFSLINTKISLEKKHYTEADLVLKNAVLSFENMFEKIEYELEQAANSYEVVNSNNFVDDKRLVNLLESFEKTISNSMAVKYGMEDGRVFTGYKLQLPQSYDHRKTNWYSLSVENKYKTIWTEPYLDYIKQRIVITAAKTVLSPSRNVNGVIAVDFDISTLSSILGNSRIGKKGFVMLLSKSGTVIANRDNYLIGERVFSNDFYDRIVSRNTGEMEYSILGEEYHLKYDKVTKNGMVLVAAMNKGEIYSYLQETHLPVLIVGLFCLIVFGIIAYFSALKGIAPLEKFVVLMRQAENGDYNVYATMNQYIEISSISKSFNNMINSIKKRDDELNQSYRELAAAEQILRQQYEEIEKSQQILKANEDKIRNLAYYDPLTGLANRGKLIDYLNETIIKACYDSTIGSVIYIDLDNFKTINDTMGHTIGDKLLVKVSQRFNGTIQNEKIIARIGGDEFVIVVNGLSSVDSVTDIAGRIVKIFEEPVVIDYKSFNITASMGIALFPEHGTTVEELMKKADMAMYKAKGKGKNCYQFFNESIHVEIITKANIQKGLRDALKNNEFTLNYQPKYNLTGGRIEGVEALLRWYSPILGYVPPLKFIKIAEETGLIVPIEKWVLKNTCLFAKRVYEEISKSLKFSVNISVVHIMQSDFARNVKETIAETGVKPELIELEITETVMMESFDSNKKKLEELKVFGVGIHLDDFGSGYSSLNYLQNLPIDYVKIDKVFVDTMTNSDRNSRVIATIVELAHNIGLKVIAEGVESKEQYDLLRDYNCDIIQGYYISRPVPQEEIIELISLLH